MAKKKGLRPKGHIEQVLYNMLSGYEEALRKDPKYADSNMGHMASGVITALLFVLHRSLGEEPNPLENFLGSPDEVDERVREMKSREWMEKFREN